MADGFAIDTSSYPKPVAPANPLDTISKVINIQQGQQGLQSNALTIDKQKLDLVNQRFAEFTKTLTGLRNKSDLSEKTLSDWATNQVKMGYVTPEMAGQFINQLPPTQGLPPDKARAALVDNIDTNITHAMTVKEALDYHLGTSSTQNDQANSYQGVTQSPAKGGGFVPATKLPLQPPPTQPNVNNNPASPNYMQPGIVGPSGPAGVQPANVPTPQPRPAGLPIAQSGPTGPTTNNGTDFNNRFSPVVTGPPPLFDKGATALNEDQTQALGRATAMKPAEQALKIMQSNKDALATGPGTEGYSKLVAAAKAWGIADTKIENDPTILRQELEKKLAQYVSSSPIAARSDAAQALSEASSPNPSVQNFQALQKLTKDALALDRVQIARPNAFTDAKGNPRKDLQNYGQHRATFPQSMDERAFGLGDLPKDEATSLVKKMLDKYAKNPNNPEAQKFLRSIDVAKKQGFNTTGIEEE